MLQSQVEAEVPGLVKSLAGDPVLRAHAGRYRVAEAIVDEVGDKAGETSFLRLLERAELRPVGDRPEPGVRKGITFVPKRGARAVLETRR